jgi:hypothetical protein
MLTFQLNPLGNCILQDNIVDQFIGLHDLPLEVAIDGAVLADEVGPGGHLRVVGAPDEDRGAQRTLDLSHRLNT